MHNRFYLRDTTLALTGGFKLQHNSFTGFEIQPGIRAIWTPDQHHSVWTAVSRAVRTPSVQEHDLHVYAPVQSSVPPTSFLLEGNPSFRSEVVLAYEIGYRQRIGRSLSVDLAGFINAYSDLGNSRTLSPYIAKLPTPTIIIPVIYDNALEAHSRGMETALSWDPVHVLHFQTSYAWTNARLRPTTNEPVAATSYWNTPTNTASVHGTWVFARNWSLNSSLYSVSKLERPSETPLPPVKQYQRLDMHLSLNLLESLELSAGGNNMLQGRHPEFDPQDSYSVRSQVPRNAFVKLVWSF